MCARIICAADSDALDDETDNGLAVLVVVVPYIDQHVSVADTQVDNQNADAVQSSNNDEDVAVALLDDTDEPAAIAMLAAVAERVIVFVFPPLRY